mgnify:CR=1 FL=1
MGEYAKRKIDGVDVKIGTCEDMFNCRYDQIIEVIYPYMSDNLYWRIPTPDEDGIQPGDFNQSLLLRDIYTPWKLKIDASKFSEEDKSDMKQSGTIQLKELVARKYSLPPWSSNGAIQNQQGEHCYLNGVQWTPRYTVSERLEE